MPESSNDVRDSYANKGKAPNLLITNVSTERFCFHGIVFYQTDKLGKRFPRRFTLAPFLQRKNNLTSPLPNFTAFAITISGNVMSNETFSLPCI